MNNQEIKEKVRNMAYAIEKFKAERTKLTINKLLEVKDNDLAMDYITELWKGYTLAKHCMEEIEQQANMIQEEENLNSLQNLILNKIYANKTN